MCCAINEPFLDDKKSEFFSNFMFLVACSYVFPIHWKFFGDVIHLCILHTRPTLIQGPKQKFLITSSFWCRVCLKVYRQASAVDTSLQKLKKTAMPSPCLWQLECQSTTSHSQTDPPIEDFESGENGSKALGYFKLI